MTARFSALSSSPPGGTDAGVLQARLAARLADALREESMTLPHPVSERLRAGREQALARARERRAATAPVVVASGRGGAALARPAPWWMKAASVFPLLLLLLGLAAIDRLTEAEQVHAAAEIDAVLLADDLPPVAYADPGFLAFLKTPSASTTP